MRFTFALAALVAALAASRALAAPPDPLAQVSLDWARDWQVKNLDATLALYSRDAVFINPDGSRVSGKAALRPFFAGVLKMYSAKPAMRSVKSGASGDLGFDWGDYSEVITPVANPAGAIQTHGTYTVVLRRVSGRWLIAVQSWTGDKPVPVKK